MPHLSLSDLPAPPPDRVGWPWTEDSPPLPALAPDGRPWPRISIVTPSYNQGAYLEETLRSVLLQGYPNLEYLVVDGGSTDASVAVIQKYASWLDYWVSEKDHGQAEAINKGFTRTTGDLIGWLNSDDYLVSGALERLALAHLAHPGALLLGDVELFTQDGSFAQVFQQRGITFEHMVQVWRMGFTWSQPGTYVPQATYRQVGGLDEGLRFVFDRDWMCRLLQVAPVHYLGVVVVRFRMHAMSKTVAEAPAWLPEQVAVTERYWAKIPGMDRQLARAELEVWYGALPHLSVMRHKMNRRQGLRHLGRAIAYSWRIIASVRFLMLCAVVVTPTPVLRFVRRFVRI